MFNTDPVCVFLYYPTPISAVISSCTDLRQIQTIIILNYPSMFLAPAGKEAFQLRVPSLKAKPVELSSYPHCQYAYGVRISKLYLNMITNNPTTCLCLRHD